MTKSPTVSFGRRSAARLAALQAVYQFEDGAQDIESIILEFLAHRSGATVEKDGQDPTALDMDRTMFSDVARGVSRRQGELDRYLAAALPERWPVERLEKILRNIMRCGAYELQMRPDVPFRVIINEYVELAKDFYGEDEPAMVNAVLDRVAKQLRQEERGAGHGDDSQAANR